MHSELKGLLEFSARLTDAALGWTGSAARSPGQIAPRATTPCRKSGDIGDESPADHGAHGVEASPLVVGRRGQRGDRGGDAAGEVRAFVRTLCVLDPSVWSCRDELWAAYAGWAGAERLCHDRHELEAPLLAARVAAIGMTGDIIAGVGLKEHWSETHRKGGRKA